MSKKYFIPVQQPDFYADALFMREDILSSKNLTPLEKFILAYLEQYPAVTEPETLSRDLGTSVENIKKSVIRLKERGLICSEQMPGVVRC